MAEDKINEFKIYKEGGQAEVTSITKAGQTISYDTNIIVEVPPDLDDKGKAEIQSTRKAFTNTRFAI